MANKQEKFLEKGYKNIKETTSKLHGELLTTTEEVVEGTIASGKQWQDLMEKSIKGGSKIVGKQQVFVIDTVAELKSQVEKDVKRYYRLFGLDKLVDRGNERIADLRKDFKKVAPGFQEDVEEAVEKTKKRVSKTRKAVEKAADKTIKRVKERVEDLREDVEEAVGKTMDVIKDEGKAKAEKNDLKVIDGIGPKMEKILVAAGYTTYQDLAKANAAEVKEMLIEVSSRYSMFDPQLWINQAKLASAGKWKELDQYIDKIKKGTA